MNGKTILLIVLGAVALPTLQLGSGSMDHSRTGEDAWTEFGSSMARMHHEMDGITTTGNSDEDFVKLMLPHHQAAIDMAKVQLLFGKDPQMRRLAQEIVTDQKLEMDVMQLWLEQHGKH